MTLGEKLMDLHKMNPIPKYCRGIKFYDAIITLQFFQIEYSHIFEQLVKSKLSKKLICHDNAMKFILHLERGK